MTDELTVQYLPVAGTRWQSHSGTHAGDVIEITKSHNGHSVFFRYIPSLCKSMSRAARSKQGQMTVRLDQFLKQYHPYGERDIKACDVRTIARALESSSAQFSERSGQLVTPALAREQLEREERKVNARIAELEQQLAEIEAEAESTSVVDDPDPSPDQQEATIDDADPEPEPAHERHTAGDTNAAGDNFYVPLATKYCPTCKQKKLLGLFGRNRSKKDGLQAICKSCRAAEHAADQMKEETVITSEHIVPTPPTTPTETLKALAQTTATGDLPLTRKPSPSDKKWRVKAWVYTEIDEIVMASSYAEAARVIEQSGVQVEITSISREF